MITVAVLLSSYVFSVANAAITPSIWPLPKSWTKGSESMLVDVDTLNQSPNFFRFEGSPNNPTLEQMIERYEKITFPHVVSKSVNDLRSTTEPSMGHVMIQVTDTDESHPQLATDESYELSIAKSGNAILKAQTIWGVNRGLETFSQLVQFDHATETYHIDNTPLTITDSPRFPHRGLMIDTARHFETLDSIRNIIDTLPYAKLNVLHWHMVDSQSFPFQSKTYPNLWNGAWSEYEKYTQDDIKSIVEYARLRGVRVIVEFDVPGHAASWCTGYPEICPSTTCQQPLNVANNKTFDVIESIIKECTGGRQSARDDPSGIFPDDFFHLGGDEVDTSCWTSTESVNKWLVAHNMTGDDAYAYFAKRAAGLAISNGRRPVQWSEVYDHFKTKLDKKTIVHIWKGNTNVTEVVANGYNVLLNVGYAAHSWYLDNLAANWTAQYTNLPCENNQVPDSLCPMILGGHGEMWGETVDTSDIQQTVWPRLAAIAERLWSPLEQTRSTDEAFPRIEYFRCLLNRRGVAAAPVNNTNARSSPPGPGSCFEQ
eukprot:g1530.t1